MLYLVRSAVSEYVRCVRVCPTYYSVAHTGRVVSQQRLTDGTDADDYDDLWFYLPDEQRRGCNELFVFDEEG